MQMCLVWQILFLCILAWSVVCDREKLLMLVGWKRNQGEKRRGSNRLKGKERWNWTSPCLSLFHTECMNCTSFTDMNSRINAVESKVKKIPLMHPKWPFLCHKVCPLITSDMSVWDLLLSFQIKLLEEERTFLPTVSSLPEGSTDNEVDTPQPTPIGPPAHLPPGVNTWWQACDYTWSHFMNKINRRAF